ncbi:hypothetical protein FACS189481_2220 [Clostridia bacterium]|nr:hypothetical protein FACS189481_2220 [Clostridia bacterium]
MREILAKTKSDLIRLAFSLVLFDVVFCLVLFFINGFAVSSLVSVLLGSVCSFLNFAFLNIAVHRAIEMAVSDAKSHIRRSYAGRYFLLAAVSALFLQFEFFNLVAFFLPMFVPKFYLLFSVLIQKRR